MIINSPEQSKNHQITSYGKKRVKLEVMITGKCTYFDRIKEICSQLCFPKITFFCQVVLNKKTKKKKEK